MSLSRNQGPARRFLGSSSRLGEQPVLRGAGQVALSWNDQVGSPGRGSLVVHLTALLSH